MEKKVNYLMFDGVKYEAVEQEKNISGACDGCCFLTVDGVCAMPGTDGFSISCDDGFIFVNEEEVAAQQRLTERSEKELDLDNPIGFKIIGPSPEPDKADNDTDEKEAARASNVKVYVADKEGKDFVFTGTLIAGKVTRAGAIGKRSYYSFPNGVEAEDICRYLPFNLGNVVKYVCRAGRIDGYTKIEDLKKAKDYLDNEIERLKEEFRNEIQGLKDKIAKEKDDDD